MTSSWRNQGYLIEREQKGFCLLWLVMCLQVLTLPSLPHHVVVGPKRQSPASLLNPSHPFSNRGSVSLSLSLSVCLPASFCLCLSLCLTLCLSLPLSEGFSKTSVRNTCYVPGRILTCIHYILVDTELFDCFIVWRVCRQLLECVRDSHRKTDKDIQTTRQTETAEGQAYRWREKERYGHRQITRQIRCRRHFRHKA